MYLNFGLHHFFTLRLILFQTFWNKQKQLFLAKGKTFSQGSNKGGPLGPWPPPRFRGPGPLNFGKGP